MEKVTVIITVLNEESTILELLKSLEKQSLLPTEVIVVDGGSTDGTLEYIQRFAERHSHVRLLSRPGLGQSAAMNLGISMATGDVLGILNDDDYYGLGVLKRVSELFKHLPNPSFVAADCNIWLKGGVLLRVDRPTRLGITDLLQGPQVYPFPCNPSSYFYHRSLHEFIGLYDETDDYTMDVEFIFRAARAAHCVYVEETWGNFRFFPGTKTYEDIQQHRCGIRVAEKIHKHERILPWHLRTVTVIKRFMLRVQRIARRFMHHYLGVAWLPPFVKGVQLPRCVRRRVRQFSIARGLVVPSSPMQIQTNPSMQRWHESRMSVQGVREAAEIPEHVLSASMPGKPSICLIALYIGQWPQWMSFFYETCRYNPTIHWLLVGSEPLPSGAPWNIQYLSLDLPAFNRLASERLGLQVEVHPQFLRKFCDFKCTYGRLFEECLSPYTFWGHCDLDVVFGDIRYFLTREILDKYDVISSYGLRLNGPFTIYRKTPELLRFYEKNDMHAVVFSDTWKPYSFDEYYLTQTVQELAARGELRLRLDDTFQRHDRHGGLHYWYEGNLLDACSRKPALLFHFAQWKKQWTNQAFSFDALGPKAFVILREGLFQFQRDWSDSLKDDYNKALINMRLGYMPH